MDAVPQNGISQLTFWPILWNNGLVDICSFWRLQPEFYG